MIFQPQGLLGHLTQARSEVKKLEDQVLGNLGILLDNLKVQSFFFSQYVYDLYKLVI